jgi:SAM-dependent MidA family methyltransferase
VQGEKSASSDSSLGLCPSFVIRHRYFVISMSPLTSLLQERIMQFGPIPFRDFMESALYHPAHGYYAAGRAVIGREGDFFTNVSVGPLFGRLLARQFAEMWERLGKPSRFTIVEQGAHGGGFARDVLNGLWDFAPGCFSATRYVIVEPSDALRRRQEEQLGPFGTDLVQWRTAVTDLVSFEGVHFSNELADAFPVHRIRWTGGEWVERHVEWAGGRFVFVDGPLSSTLLQERLAHMPRNLRFADPGVYRPASLHGRAQPVAFYRFQIPDS